MTDTAEFVVIQCEQMLFTSARNTLDGPGYGIVGMSKGWPGVTGSRRAVDLGIVRTFLPQGATYQFSADVPVPTCLALYRINGIPVAARKTYVGQDSMGRPGNYLVHALADPSDAMRARHVIACWSEDLPRSDIPRGHEPSDDMATVALCLPRRHEPAYERGVDADMLRALLPRLAEAVLAMARNGCPVTLTTDVTEKAVILLDHVMAVLPAGVTDALTFSTFEHDALKPAVDIAVITPPFSIPPVDGSASQLNLVTGEYAIVDRSEEEAGAADDIVRSYLDGVEQGNGPPEDADASGLLDWWLVRKFSSGDPDDLLHSQLTLLLASPHASGWLLQPAGRSRVLRSLARGSAAERDEIVGALAVAGLLAEDSTGRDDLIGEALERISGALLDGRTSEAQPLVAAVRELRVRQEDLDLHVATRATEALRARQVSERDLPALWSYIEGAGERLTAEDRRRWLSFASVREKASRRWSSLSAALLAEQIRSPEVRSASVPARALERFPHESAAVFDDELLAGTALASILTAFPTTLWPAGPRPLVRVLLLMQELPQGALLREVVGSAALTTPARRKLLAEFWPQLAAQAGIPAQVASLLAPPSGDDDSGSHAESRSILPRRRRARGR